LDLKFWLGVQSVSFENEMINLKWSLGLFLEIITTFSAFPYSEGKKSPLAFKCLGIFKGTNAC